MIEYREESKRLKRRIKMKKKKKREKERNVFLARCWIDSKIDVVHLYFACKYLY